MNAIPRLVKTESLILDHFFEAMRRGLLTVDYDPVSDTLYMRLDGPMGMVVHYLDDQTGLLYDPESMEVVGIQIEAFHRNLHQQIASQLNPHA